MPRLPNIGMRGTLALGMVVLLSGTLSAIVYAQPTQPVSAFPVAGAITRESVAESGSATGVFRRMAGAPGANFLSAQPGRDRALWTAPLLSALLPGSGQGVLRQQRGVVYAALEGYLILQALRSSRDASRERDAYREIARSVARASTGGARPDGAWPYYETMQYVLESGAYNRTPGSGFTPESDPGTFNGSIWLLARETYWRDPDVSPDAGSAEYQRALEFYQRRAAGEDFLWSWRDAQLEQDLYRQTIDRANGASRRTKQMVGLLLANHALSLVDAYASVRLRIYGTPAAPGAEQRFGVMGSIPLPAKLRD